MAMKIATGLSDSRLPQICGEITFCTVISTPS
jgi:hypothetical protein